MFKYEHTVTWCMDFEVPADAWHVWVGVTLVSLGLAGVAVALPGEPPPDAGRAAGALDRVAAAEYDAAVTLEHDADAVRVGPGRIAMRNNAGTDRARLVFGPVMPIDTLDLTAAERTVLDGVLAGERPLPAGLERRLADAATTLDTETGEWRPTRGALRARAVEVAGRRMVLVAV